MTSDAGRYVVMAHNVIGDVRVTCLLGVRHADFRQLRCMYVHVVCINISLKPRLYCHVTGARPRPHARLIDGKFDVPCKKYYNIDE